MKFETQSDIIGVFDEVEKNLIPDASFDAKMIMYRFLSEIERVTDERKLTRRKLAELVGTSPSYITQLYRGNKIISLELIAKLEKALKIQFKIIGQTETEKMIDHIHEELQSNYHSFDVTNRSWLNKCRLKTFVRFEHKTKHNLNYINSKYSSFVEEEVLEYKPKLKIVA